MGKEGPIRFMASARPILVWATLVLLVAFAVMFVSGFDRYLLLTPSRLLTGCGDLPYFVARCSAS
jgi:hypothetical protein